MIDREKAIKGLEICIKNIDKVDCPNDCPYYSDCTKYENRYVFQPLLRDALILLKELKEQEAREMTIDEWREWKENPKRNPICELWENDTSPIWVLYPNNVSELALLMGKLKLFTGKPTLEQCKAVKWDE